MKLGILCNTLPEEFVPAYYDVFVCACLFHFCHNVGVIRSKRSISLINRNGV